MSEHEHFHMTQEMKEDVAQRNFGKAYDELESNQKVGKGANQGWIKALHMQPSLQAVRAHYTKFFQTVNELVKRHKEAAHKAARKHSSSTSPFAAPPCLVAPPGCLSLSTVEGCAQEGVNSWLPKWGNSCDGKDHAPLEGGMKAVGGIYRRESMAEAKVLLVLCVCVIMQADAGYAFPGPGFLEFRVLSISTSVAGRQRARCIFGYVKAAIGEARGARKKVKEREVMQAALIACNLRSAI
eukprot:1161613-Pelagomonas_calceolata.AAC.8